MNRAQQMQAQGRTQGTLEKGVPCPWCGKINDFTDDTEMLEVGNSFSCDHCRREYLLIDIKRPTLIWAQRR